jgi:glycosyltransferase involved in cell wall biosynthesis
LGIEVSILNVLFLSEQIYPHSGGAELATYLFAKSLSEQGFNIRIITNRFPSEPVFSQDGRLSIYRLPLYDKTDTIKYKLLSKIDVSFSNFLNSMIKWADVVYIPRFWFSAIPLAKAHKKPVITHLHDYIPICPLATFFDSSKSVACEGAHFICSPKCTYYHEKMTKSPFNRMMASLYLNSISGSLFSGLIGMSDAIICVSNAQKKTISDNGFFAHNKISVVNNLFLDKNTPILGEDFGFFGGDDKQKGFEILKSAVVTLNSSRVKPFRIHAAKLSKINKSCALELGESGFYIYGKLTGKAFEDVYKKVRTVLVPSIGRECAPYVVIEALLSGRYVIASRIGGIPELVDTCKGVTLFEAGNSDQLKIAMETVQSMDRSTLTELGLQNKAAFLRRYSNEKSLKQFINVINRVT